jgi:hypothetical protein
MHFVVVNGQVKFQKICFWEKEIEKQTKFATHKDLWKYGSIFVCIHNFEDWW